MSNQTQSLPELNEINELNKLMIKIPENLLINGKYIQNIKNFQNLNKFDSFNHLLEIIFQNIDSFQQLKSLYQADQRFGKYIEQNIVILTDDIELPTNQMLLKDGLLGLNIDKFSFNEISTSLESSNKLFNNNRYKFFLLYFIDIENFHSLKFKNLRLWNFLQKNSSKIENSCFNNKFDISKSFYNPINQLYNISEEQPKTTQFQLNKSPNRSRSNSRNHNNNSSKSKICDLGYNKMELNERQQRQQEICVLGFFIFVISLMVYLVSRG
ncbi:hypothetical protein BN7_3855 [Wickerhamomyces ciferrii]|uniref:Transmembrane protein n=1 Tax=Wickerhamomyces ciferrii (strain ATCC 14091 / BCRC 22168 / CBS 111 / JCM 3599 / NBRC 0793 / NRRL Y-1031 F-60-10) TaxID=1206466 RepID=K0KSK1_WICCF|nr:uncharacterized protein BN7_3855 [Wickerhamomyces ciferrii]CCH44293.1 hypothetical protein BN7_3855 [Wickerhamomyces ciferrii]